MKPCIFMKKLVHSCKLEQNDVKFEDNPLTCDI